jgi:leucyl aminopeptidase
MDYRASVAQGPAVSQVNADALLVILTPDLATTGDPVLDGLIKDATATGDFALKSGRSLYVHRPAGVKAPRVVLLAAADDKPKSFKAAVAKGVSQVKELKVGNVVVATAQGFAPGADHAHALVQAVADATYVYRHTKPSAPKPGALGKITLLVADADLASVKAGLTQGQAVSEGVTLARELGNRPANYCTPTFLASEAKRLAREFKHINPWCWWARASPSTPAASPSSPPPRWTR